MLVCVFAICLNCATLPYVSDMATTRLNRGVLNGVVTAFPPKLLCCHFVSRHSDSNHVSHQASYFPLPPHRFLFYNKPSASARCVHTVCCVITQVNFQLTRNQLNLTQSASCQCRSSLSCETPPEIFRRVIMVAGFDVYNLVLHIRFKIVMSKMIILVIRIIWYSTWKRFESFTHRLGHVFYCYDRNHLNTG